MGGTYRNNDGVIENLSGGNIVDAALDKTSDHAISNAATATKFEEIDDALGDTDISDIGDGTVTGAVSQLNSDLKASDNLIFKFTKDATTGKYGYLDKNGNFIPFKTTHTLTKSITAGTSTSTTDMGEDHEYRYVSVAPTLSQEKTITASRSAQTVTPDNGKLLSKVIVNKFPDASGNYPTSGNITSNGTHDMGASNNYRYVKVAVPNTLKIQTLKDFRNSQQTISCNNGDYFVFFNCIRSKLAVTNLTVMAEYNEYGAQCLICRATSTTVKYYNTDGGILTHVQRFYVGS